MTTSIKFFYNGIKINGENKLIRCFYSLDNSTRESGPCVTIYAKGYGAELPGDLFAVENDTDIMTDYFDTDSATLTPAHPLYHYARAAALKAAMRGEPEYIEKLEQRIASGKLAPWQNADSYRAEVQQRREKLAAMEQELQRLPKGHPTAADVEAVHDMNTAAETARRAREHAAQLERREKAIRTRNESRAFIAEIAAAHPITEGAPVVTVEWSENAAFEDGEKLSVAAAEIIFKTLDEKIHADPERGYDKTSFTIDYTNADGEADTYKGRYDLGDNDGGLIAHIRNYGKFYMEKGRFGTGPTDEDRKMGAAIVAVADLLDGYTHKPRVISVTPAPWLAEYQRQKAEQEQQKLDEIRDIMDAVEMLTDEQVESVIFAISPHDKEKLDVARFFLQELRRRDEAHALDVFRRWKAGA